VAAKFARTLGQDHEDLIAFAPEWNQDRRVTKRLGDDAGWKHEALALRQAAQPTLESFAVERAHLGFEA